VRVWLSEEETQAVLQEVPAVYHTQINDVLVTAVAKAFRRWTGRDELLVEMEGHGREELFEGVDVTRTVGWFTSMYPVRVRLGEGYGEEASEERVGEELKRVKEQLRGVPGRGVGYGMLRYVSGDREAGRAVGEGAKAEVSFNYLGQFDQVLGEEGLWKGGAGRVGAERGAGEKRARLVDINGSVVGGRLEVSWRYGREVHKRETIEQLGEWFLEGMREIVRHCRQEGAGGYTLSDFPLARLDKQRFDRVAMLIEESDESETAVAD